MPDARHLTAATRVTAVFRGQEPRCFRFSFGVFFVINRIKSVHSDGRPFPFRMCFWAEPFGFVLT